MVSSIYRKAFDVLMKKPVTLWGITLLSGLLSVLAAIGFGALPIGAFVVQIGLDASMAMIYLNSYRTGLRPKSSYLFSAFKKDRIGRVIGGMAWMMLWVFLWSLIPIVGIVFGVIRLYEYRFTPYILMTRDDVKATEAIQISKQETMGYKGQMFWADVLVYLLFGAAAIVLGLFGSIPYIGVLFRIVNFLLSVVFVLLVPLFLGIVQAAFYVEIKSGAPAATIPAQDAAPAEGVSEEAAQDAEDAPAEAAPEAPAPAEEASAEAPSAENTTPEA